MQRMSEIPFHLARFAAYLCCAWSTGTRQSAEANWHMYTPRTRLCPGWYSECSSWAAPHVLRHLGRTHAPERGVGLLDVTKEQQLAGCSPAHLSAKNDSMRLG